MNETKALTLEVIREARSTLDGILAIDEYTDPALVKALRDRGEEVVSRLVYLRERLEAPRSDGGGPRVWSAIPDSVPPSIFRQLRDRLREHEERSGSVARVGGPNAKGDARNALLDALIAFYAAEDFRTSKLLAALLEVLDEEGA